MPKRRKVEEDFILTEEEKNKKKKEVIKNVFFNKPKVSGKNESQRNLIRSIKNNEITICTGIAGSGKAQPLSAIILSKNGYVDMGDVKINDEIFTKNGNLTKINAIFPQGIKDIYKITFSDNSTTECCEEHLWLTWNEKERNLWKGKKINRKKIKHSGTVRSIKEIKKNILVRDNRLNYSIPIVEPIQFKKRNLKIDPYLLGILLGDGCFRGTIKLSTADNEIINECENLINKNYYFKKSKSRKYDYSILNKISNKKHSFRYLIDDLKLLELKSHEKFIPHNYLFSNIDDRIKILQGLMDSDGTINKKGTTFSFTTTSEKLIFDLKHIVESLGGIINPIKEKIKKYKYKGKVKKGKLSYEFTFRLPNNIIPFKLKRKRDLITKKVKYFPIRYIKNIEYVGKKETQCISVDDKSKLYITNDFIVTHNTFVSLAYALSLLYDQKNSYNKIYLVKSVTTLKNEEVGFLKGDLREKFEPFMWSFKINMEKVLEESEIKTLFGLEIVRPFPLAYIKGTSLDNALIIADEIQNVSLDNCRVLLTRIGNNSKLILIGDSNQIDIKDKNQSCLEPLMNMFDDNDEIGTIRMSDKDDNCRNPLIKTIENKFKSYFENLSIDDIKKLHKDYGNRNDKQYIHS